MPRLLIAGCGYLGQAVADLFLAEAWDVEGWTMSPESAQQLSTKPYRVRAVDITKEDRVCAQMNDFDAVIHSASTRGGDASTYESVYFNGAQNLSKRFSKARFLFVSSTSVYAQNDSGLVTEESPAEPKHETGRILRKTEAFVLANGGIVARLAGIYGPNRSALLRKFLAGEGTLDRQNDRLVNQIHRDDAASAMQILVQQGAAGEIYNVVDDQPILLSECYGWLAERLKRPLPRVDASASLRKRGESNKRVSNAKLRAIGWAPRYLTFPSGMEKSVLPGFPAELA